ncbi:hypothetical protein OROGR_026428 [Orobanche gracilis]
MSSVAKSLLKFVANLRFYKKRIDQGFLLKRIHGGPLEDTPYFSALSPEDYWPTRQISSYLLEDFKVVLGSCNGLVCLDNSTKHSLLWNPSTDESKIIPSDYMRKHTSIARDHCFAGGFGYDSRSDDFKLIRFIYGFGRDSFEYGALVFKNHKTELYSLRTNSWKYIDHPGYFILRKPSTYIDGCNYWLAIGKKEHFVLKFDFADEELSDHALPRDPDANKYFGLPPNLDFVEFEGSLGVLFFPILGTEKRFHLWLLTDGESWTKECEFLVAGVDRPLGFWGRVLLFEGLNRQLMAYDIDTRDIKKVGVYDFPRKMQLVPYVESNVSIQGLFGTL